MLCFLCCFTGSRRLCFCRRGRQLCIVSSSDLTVVDGKKVAMESYRNRIRYPRRTNSEPPVRSRRVIWGTVRFQSLREKKKKEGKLSCFQVSMVSIPSSYDARRSIRRNRRKWLRQQRERQRSHSTCSSCSIPSEPRLRGDMDHNGDEISPLASYDNDLPEFKSQSDFPFVLNGKNSSLSSSFDQPRSFEIERLQLSSPPFEQTGSFPENWELKESYKRDLETYINSSALPSNPWADPFEEDRRSRTEQWIESLTPERMEESGEISEPSSSNRHSSQQNSRLEEEDDLLIENVESNLSSPEIKLVGIEAEVELIWDEKPVKENMVLQDVVIKLNGEPVKALHRPTMQHIEAQDSLEQPPSDISFVSSTIDKFSLVKQKYRSNLQSALEHSGDTIDLQEIERFWNYQYTTPEQQNVIEETRIRKEMERIRGHTPTMERVVMYYTSDKRPSLTVSPTPSVRSGSSYSDAYRLFDRKSITPSPRPKLSRMSFDSEDLDVSIEQDNLTEEITIEVPFLAPPPNNLSNFFHLEKNPSDEDDECGRVELPNGTLSPVRLFLSPHPRLRVSRSTSTEDLFGSSDGRSPMTEIVPHIPKRYHSSATQTMDNLLVQPLVIQTVDPTGTTSDVDSISIDDLLATDFRAGSSSPSKTVSFAQKIDTDIDNAPKHRYDPVFRQPKPILKRLDTKTAELRKIVELAADRLYKDLRMLVEERDRCIHGLKMLPSENKDLSLQSSLYQTNYRDKLLQNKGMLDAKIDNFWTKLKTMPLTEAQSLFVYAVEESKVLTMNVKRKVIPVKFLAGETSHIERRTKTNLEMASDYARKLADVRKMMIRRDSDIVQDDEKSVEEILKRVSASLSSFKTSST